jgi:ketosteroid isomerase-like protein/TolB-like protein
MKITPRGDRVDAWWGDLTRDMLNATLNKFTSVAVVSKEEIDFIREKEGIAEIEAARRLGIDRMITGTLDRRGTSLVLRLQVVEPGTGRMAAAREAQGPESELERIQGRGAVEVIKALDVRIPSSQLDEVLRLEGGAGIDRYRMMAETMGGFADEGGTPRPTEGQPRSDAWPWVATAHAGDADEAAVAAVLERYRKALESKDPAKVAEVYVELNDRVRDALVAYFSNTKDLRVAFDDVAVHLSGDEALASFTRKDEFVDQETGREVKMELRVSSVLERREGEWRIRGLKRPS